MLQNVNPLCSTSFWITRPGHMTQTLVDTAVLPVASINLAKA
jgi:hypothetical protein